MLSHLLRWDFWLGDMYGCFSEQKLEKDLEARVHGLLGAGR